MLSSLHTNDAPGSITRLLELGVAPYLVNATVLGILAQRLVRTLCPHCKQPDDSFDQTTFQQAVAPWRPSTRISPYKPVGCPACRNTGYLGRLGLYELLVVSPALRSLVAANAPLVSLRQQAVSDGMRPLRLAGALKVAEGSTTLDEVLHATPVAQG